MQFLPPAGPLEALNDAIQTDVQGAPTWAMTAEHLVAIALKTGRAKDCARSLQFLEQDAVDVQALNKILLRYGLIPQWQRF